MLLGEIGSGVDPAHPSFHNDPACGYGQDGTPDKLISAQDCSSTDAEGLCNDSEPLNPTDSLSHGNHVASTAADNRLDATADHPPQPPGASP